MINPVIVWQAVVYFSFWVLVFLFLRGWLPEEGMSHVMGSSEQTIRRGHDYIMAARTWVTKLTNGEKMVRRKIKSIEESKYIWWSNLYLLKPNYITKMKIQCWSILYSFCNTKGHILKTLFHAFIKKEEASLPKKYHNYNGTEKQYHWNPFQNDFS